MALLVPHRFLSRLLPDERVLTIRYLLIGTFNPGLPLEDLMTDQEKLAARSIVESKQYKKIDAVRNFYDRPASDCGECSIGCISLLYTTSTGISCEIKMGLSTLLN
jgi:hypothetical protein